MGTLWALMGNALTVPGHSEVHCWVLLNTVELCLGKSLLVHSGHCWVPAWHSWVPSGHCWAPSGFYWVSSEHSCVNLTCTQQGCQHAEMQTFMHVHTIELSACNCVYVCKHPCKHTNTTCKCIWAAILISKASSKFHCQLSKCQPITNPWQQAL